MPTLEFVRVAKFQRIGSVNYRFRGVHVLHHHPWRAADSTVYKSTLHAQQQQKQRTGPGRQEDERPMASASSWGCLWTSLAAKSDGLEGDAGLLALEVKV